MSLFSGIFPAIVVDIGSSRCQIASQHEILEDEASFLAFNTETKKVVAIGSEAASMIGRVAAHIRVIQPFQHGEVYDAHWAKEYLKILLQRKTSLKRVLSPTFIYSIPATATKAVHQVYAELFFSLGGNEVISVSSPLAASIGAGIPIADSSGSFIFHIGDGLAEAGVISLGSIVAAERSDTGLSIVRKKMQLLLKKQFQLHVSIESCQDLLEKLDIQSSQRSEANILVPGKDAKNGNPTELLIPENEVTQPIIELASEYSKVVSRLLSRIPTSLTGDVIDKGLLLSGGGAQMKGLEQYLTKKLGVAVSTVDIPSAVVVEGLMTILQNLDDFKSSLGYISDVAGTQKDS